jgi:flagellar biosynthesis protein FliR
MASLPVVLVAFGLAAARIVPVVWQFPPLGGRRAPLPIRLLLGAMVAALFAPMVLSAIDAPVDTAAAVEPGALVLVVARELLVGLSIGFCAGAAFRAAELAGELASVSVGRPAIEAEPGGGVAGLYQLLSVVAFLELGGLGMLAQALTLSYRAIPLRGAPRPEDWAAWRGAAELVVLTTARLWESAFTLAAPVVVATWLATLALAALGRVVPELGGGGALWLSVRPWLGLGILLVGVGVFESAAFRTWFGGLWPLVGAALDVWRRR